MVLLGMVAIKAEQERKRYDLTGVSDRLRIIHIAGPAIEGAGMVTDREYVDISISGPPKLGAAYKEIIQVRIPFICDKRSYGAGQASHGHSYRRNGLRF
jgi:hypothetical protein